jgi:hypothetical protein
MLSSLCLILAVGLAIILECQQLSRTVQFVDAPHPTVASHPIISAPILRASAVPEHRDRPPTRKTSACALPVWKPGFQWQYRWSDQRGSGIYVRVVTGEEIVDGVPYYVMQTGNRNIYWATADLAWLMEQVNGEIESQALPAYRKFIWPLEPGKTWVARYQWTHPGEGKTEERFRRHRIVGPESVQVPAGTYQALRTVVTDSSGKKLSEYWYAPEARWLVKERVYGADGVRDRELIYSSLWPKTASR